MNENHSLKLAIKGLTASSRRLRNLRNEETKILPTRFGWSDFFLTPKTREIAEKIYFQTQISNVKREFSKQHLGNTKKKLYFRTFQFEPGTFKFPDKCFLT